MPSAINLTRRSVTMGGLASCGAFAAPAFAQSAGQWPERPVRIIVPLGAGGPADLVGRYVAQQLGERLKQSFFIENRPGAAGIIGTGEAAKAAPDGYTFVIVGAPHVNLEILSHNKPYQLMRDFVSVAVCASTDAVMVVHPSVPAKTVKEFIELAKSKPGALTYASSGPGSNKHLGGELFKLMTGTDILHVAYKGSTQARNDIIGGHVQMMFDEVPSVAPNVLAGQVRALGVTGSKRSSGLPNVPTVAESVPGYEHTNWFGIMAPAGTPKDIVEKLNAEIRALSARPDVKAYWEKQGTETIGMATAEMDTFIHAEIEKWTKVVKAANIKLD